MNTELALAVAGTAGSLLSAFVTHLVTREKYEIELERLRAEAKRIAAEKDSTNIDNTKKLIDIIMQQVALPVENEAKKLRYAVNKFTRAVEKISLCPHADICPVRRELQNNADEHDATKG